ncbi:IS6 family transposase [Halococcus thailandensis]|uniref:IS6 family transposase n=1 Tax=Halococcus thailandensis TaxID=335952 RepID=UPI0009B5CDFB|nr:IS6 family transposase [Halococcus thailandensis]
MPLPSKRCPDHSRAFAVRLHSAGLSLRETAAILELLDVDRSHGAVWDWTHRLADSQDETAIQIGTEWRWCYAAIDLDSMLVLDVEVFSRRGTDPAAAFLSRLAEHHDLSEAELLVDSFGYRTALSRLGLSGQVEYSGRNHIERWFQTLKQRTDRFYTTWNGGPASIRRWLRRFVHYYNTQRPHQALNGRTPAEEA